jgi:transcriptional regulator with XRE-family HTH domain
VRKLSIGDVIQTFRKEQGLTQEEFAEQILIDRSSVAKVENGKRQAQKHFMKQVADTFDEPRLYLAVQEEVTGGASVPYLDNADLHRAATHFKSIEEAEEALMAMRSAPISKKREQLTVADQELMKAMIIECVEAITALTHHVMVLCKEYAISYLGIWKQHRAELRAKKYMK